MKILKTNFYPTLFSLLLLLGLSSCSEDADDALNANEAQLRISANVNYSGSTNRSAVDISAFLLNLEEIELEFDTDDYNDPDDDDDNDDYNDDYDDYDDDGYLNSDDEIELQGPFEIDVLAGDPFLTVDIPAANYNELEFEFDENENPNSPLYEKTVLIEGSINGTPFIFWYDFEAEAEIDHSGVNGPIDVNEGLNAIIISFDLDQVLSQVNLAAATDGNGNGTIEINPDDTDGNEDIAEQLKNALISSADLYDD